MFFLFDYRKNEKAGLCLAQKDYSMIREPINLDTFLKEISNPAYSWIISHYLLKKGILDEFSFSESLEEQYLKSTSFYTADVENYLGKADFLEHDSPKVIFQRYKLIKEVLEDEKPDHIIVFGCGLSPLGISQLDKQYSPYVIDTDFQDVIQLKGNTFNHRKYQARCFVLGTDSIKKCFENEIGENQKIGFVFEGVFAYFDDKQVIEILDECLYTSDNCFVVGDFFVSPRKQPSKILKFPKSSFRDISSLERFLERNKIKATHVSKKNDRCQVVFKCQR